MKNFIITVIVLIAGITTSYSQQTNKPIKERLRYDIPIFSFTPCTPFLANFGSNAENVIKNAEESGIKFHSRVKLPVPEDGYMLAFYDTDNLRDNDGYKITEVIVYLFSFTKDDEYFSFSSRVTCRNVYLSQALLERLNDQIQNTWGTTRNRVGSIASTCTNVDNIPAEHELSVSTSRDNNSVNLTIIDMTYLDRTIMNR